VLFRSCHEYCSDTFYVTVNNTHDCYAFDSVVVTVYPLPVAQSLGNDTSLCYGDHITLQASPGYSSYLWNDTLAAGDALLTYSNSSDYYYAVGDDHLCTAYSDTIHVTINSLPVVYLGSDTTIIQVYNGVAVLDAGPGFVSYAWSTGATTQQITVTALSSSLGVHTVDVTVTDANGCEGSDEINITVASGAGVEEFYSDDLGIFPNPASVNITVMVPENSEIEISDISGRIVKKIFCTGKKIDMDIRDLPGGVYMIKAKTEREMLIKKIIKE
jgi:hypothetical protein